MKKPSSKRFQIPRNIKIRETRYVFVALLSTELMWLRTYTVPQTDLGSGSVMIDKQAWPYAAYTLWGRKAPIKYISINCNKGKCYRDDVPRVMRGGLALVREVMERFQMGLRSEARLLAWMEIKSVLCRFQRSFLNLRYSLQSLAEDLVEGVIIVV